MTIGVLGGTGQEGGGLAFRWALRGHDVIIGSRSAEKAAVAAQALNQLLAGRGSVRGASNLRSGASEDPLWFSRCLTRRSSRTAETVRDLLAGKILIDVTVPLMPP